MFYSVGHSNRSGEAFVRLLQASSIAIVADVRALPYSLRNPQFERAVLQASLAAHGIGYAHLPGLGGRRGPQAGAPPLNTAWGDGAYRHYADYALGKSFAQALAALRALAGRGRCAVMCAEADWRQCHRQIIVDHLLHAGETVVHIRDPGRVEPARLHPTATVSADGRLIYPTHWSAAETMPLFPEG
jgi:uncharacterized protein (DUF488 family)